MFHVCSDGKEFENYQISIWSISTYGSESSQFIEEWKGRIGPFRPVIGLTQKKILFGAQCHKVQVTHQNTHRSHIHTLMKASLGCWNVKTLLPFPDDVSLWATVIKPEQRPFPRDRPESRVWTEPAPSNTPLLLSNNPTPTSLCPATELKKSSKSKGGGQAELPTRWSHDEQRFFEEPRRMWVVSFPVGMNWIKP